MDSQKQEQKTTPDATATPRTNEAVIRRFKSWEICDRDNIYVEADFARTLERELTAAKAEIAKWKQHYEITVAEWRSMKATVELVFNRNPESKTLAELQARTDRAEAEVRRLQEQMRNRLVEVQEQQQGGITT